MNTKIEILKDKILKEFQDKFQVFLTQNYQNTGKILATGLIYGFISESLDQVREQTLKEVEKEVIGEDEGFYIPQLQANRKRKDIIRDNTRDELRREQREALTKLKGKK